MSRLEIKMAQRRLKSYPYWLEDLRNLDEWFQGITSPDLFGGCGVSGGEASAVQERILTLKESHPNYSRLLGRVEKVQAILEGLSRRGRDVVRLWHWERVDEYDICAMLEISRSTLFRTKQRVERYFAACWDLSPGEIREMSEGQTAVGLWPNGG